MRLRDGAVAYGVGSSGSACPPPTGTRHSVSKSVLVLTKTTYRPSAENAGEESTAGSSVSLVVAPVLTSRTITSAAPDSSEMNARRRASGDHAGSVCAPAVPYSFRGRPPGRTVYRSSPSL